MRESACVARFTPQAARHISQCIITLPTYMASANQSLMAYSVPVFICCASGAGAHARTRAHTHLLRIRCWRAKAFMCTARVDQGSRRAIRTGRGECAVQTRAHTRHRYPLRASSHTSHPAALTYCATLSRPKSVSAPTTNSTCDVSCVTRHARSQQAAPNRA